MSKEEGGILYLQLRKLIDVIDSMRDVGLQQYIHLPRIAVLGTQSSGKSSVLESIVGLDFLPRGDGVVTRRPLELRLVHIPDPNTAPWGVFEELKGQKFYKFNEVRDKISELTDKVAGRNKGIVDKPIILTVYSPTCPDLTLIDLPGITRIPLQGSDQPPEIEQITKGMCMKYVSDPRTIILCVVPANADLTTSEALMISRNLDTSGIRTLGVITKIDIMDRGTNAKRMLLGQEVPLRLGFVGIKNRSQEDIQKNMGVAEALEIEKKYFASHPVYSSLPQGHLGAGILSGKLTKILFTHIKHHLPDIIREIQERMDEVEERLKELGPSLPVKDGEKMQLVWNMVTDFCTIFKNTIGGRFDAKRGSRKVTKELTGGAKIKMHFYNLFKEYDSHKFHATSEYSDRDIERAIILHEGDNLPGFPSADVFVYLIQPQLEKLKEPAIDCLHEIYAYLEQLSTKIQEKTFARFPSLGDEMMETIIDVLQNERDRAKYLVESIIESEQGYMFTNDAEYIKTRTDIIPQNPPGQGEKSQKQLEPTNLYVLEMRARLDSYFKIVVRNVRDSIPKVIGYFLVKAVQEKMQFELYTKVSNSQDQISNLLGEPPMIAQERASLQSTKSTLENSIKILKRDPDITNTISGMDEDLMHELNKAKAQEKMKKQKKKEREEKKAEAHMHAQQQQPQQQQRLPQGPGGASPANPGRGQPLKTGANPLERKPAAGDKPDLFGPSKGNGQPFPIDPKDKKKY